MTIIRNEYGNSIFIAIQLKKSEVTDEMFKYILNCSQTDIDELKEDHQYDGYVDYLNMQDEIDCDIRSDHILQFIWPEDDDESLFIGVPISFESLEPFSINFIDADVQKIVNFKTRFKLDLGIKNYITCPGE